MGKKMGKLLITHYRRNNGDDRRLRADGADQNGR